MRLARAKATHQSQTGKPSGLGQSTSEPSTSGLTQETPTQTDASRPTVPGGDNNQVNHNTPVNPFPSPDMKFPTDPMLLQPDIPSINSPPISDPSLGNFSSPYQLLAGLDEFHNAGDHYLQNDEPLTDKMIFSECPLDLDSYSGFNAFAQTGMPFPFPSMSDASSTSDPSSHSRTSTISTRRTSAIPSVVDELTSSGQDAVLSAESAWPLARCNPLIYSATCPSTAHVHLEALEQLSKQKGAWDGLENYLEQADWNILGPARVISIKPVTRDTMLAIMQNFLQKAVENLRGGVNSQCQKGSGSSVPFYAVLPPSTVLECFLRTYAKNISFLYPLVSPGYLDPNEMVRNSEAWTLLVLLMTAHGAFTIPLDQAKALTAGLIGAFRISLFDIIEKDIQLCANPINLRCALLSTHLCAWSGDKWLMDIAMGQRGIYMSVSSNLRAVI